MRTTRSRWIPTLLLAVVAAATAACSTESASDPPTTLTPAERWADTICTSYTELLRVVDDGEKAASAPVVPGTNPRDALSGTLEYLTATAHGFTVAPGLEGGPSKESIEAATEQLSAFDERTQQRILPLKYRANGPDGDEPANTPGLAADLSRASTQIRVDLAVVTGTIGQGASAERFRAGLEPSGTCAPLLAALQTPPSGTVPPPPPPMEGDGSDTGDPAPATSPATTATLPR